ncbi:MAG: DUF2177 family protein [Caulobacteraceae bacterium]|nr:DUF2177 family protein [Caulobacteraceae bacterium]
MKYVIAYVGALLSMGVLDAIWLGTAGRVLYRPAIGEIMMAQGFRVAPALVFYALYLVGIVIFAVAPAFRSGQWTTAALMGGLFGFFCYMTYDLTNQATMKVWPLKITLIDISWGTALTAVAATVAFLAAKRFA